MNPAQLFAPSLTAQRGGLAPRLSPAELPLTLPVAVLRLRLAPATRLVLAEIVSLHAATGGRCDCSDAHFAARLSVSTDTANRAVQQLVAAGLVAKQVDQKAGNHRRLEPILAAIAAAATDNPYPATAPRSYRIPPAASPLMAGSPARNLPEPLAAECGINTPVIIPANFQQVPPSAAGAAGTEKKRKANDFFLTTQPEAVDSPPLVAPRPPGQKRPAAGAQCLLRESLVAAFTDFAQAWAAAAEASPDAYAPFVAADLRHYHAALSDWSSANGRRKFDWLATIRNSMRHDLEAGKLRKVGGVPGQVEARRQVIAEARALRMKRL